MKEIEISNFMGISYFKNPIDFPNITVIVGKNGTGKTGLLKLMYSIGKANEQYIKIKQHDNHVNYKKILSEKLYRVFQSRKSGLGDLVKKGSIDRLKAKLSSDDSVVDLSFGEATKTEVTNIQYSIDEKKKKNYIFIPAKEVLTAFNSIKAITNIHHYPGFDETYTDLIDALDVPTRDEQLAENFEHAKNTLIEMFGGELIQIESSDRFVFKNSNSEFAMQLTAEGIKHVGILTTLIKNRQLTENTVLFMDEPETCLHPSAIREMIHLLSILAGSNVQLFITTHNYFVLKQLHIIATKLQQSILCCSLEKDDTNNDIKSTFSDLKNEFPMNSIVEEFMDMYNEEINLNLGLK
ncbi:MAG: ATP-binding protein [Dysgonamonadaceae bacterium]|jgi:AAA15 family ATPase/GTPase|nr:ATP-binding protein [Dysgonamonadaceae bacterium]